MQTENKTNTTEEKLLRKKEAASLLACSARTVDRLVALGRLTKIMVLGGVRLNRIEKLLQGQDTAEENDTPDEETPDPIVPIAPEKVVTATSFPPPISSTATPQKPTAQPIKPPPLPASSSRPAGVRYFEFIGGASRKFWEVSMSGDVFTVRFGRIGTLGQSQTKRFPDEAKARREADNLIAEKLKKGYVEKT